MTARRPRRVALAVAGAVLAHGAALFAAPVLIATRATRDAATGDYTAFVGGVDDNGRSLKVSAVEVVPTGERTPLPAVEQSFMDWATVASEQSTTWRPPLAVGLVYLWVRNVPRGVLDGIHAFFQRLPSRTTVLPTVYGRMRQGRASLTAADISRLDEEVPPLEDYHPNMIDAVRMDLADLAANPSAIKLLLLVTDGRDFADPKGQAPGDFAALGRDIRSAGVTLFIVGYPPAADPLQSAENLGTLHESAGGVLRMLEQPEDLENTLESLGQAIADLRHVQFSVPWSWRILGSSRRVAFRLTTTAGQQLTVDAGALALDPRPLLKRALLPVALVGAMSLLLLLVILMWRRGRRPGQQRRDGHGDQQDFAESADAILVAVHALVRRGTSPQRVVQELTRTFSDGVPDLAALDPSILNDPRFPYFRTRLGRQRLSEIGELLASKSASPSRLAPVIVEVLAAAISEGLTPDVAAETISARAAVEEWTSFASLGLPKLAEELRAAARDHASLASPKARGIAVAVQDALRLGGNADRPVVVGWLVRAAGLGRRGETLRISDGRVVIGSAPGSAIHLPAAAGVASQHAAIDLEGGEFMISPLGGTLKVEGAPIAARHLLVDGETIQIGAGLFVFKMAIAGSLQGLR